jgi:hypothetical protein
MSQVTDAVLWRRAVTTLECNRQRDPSGRWHTVPSRTRYPHQWSWDAGFIAAGLARVCPRRAWGDLRSLFGAQWIDGRVPHIAFDRVGGTEEWYFPGPSFWRRPGAPRPGGGDHAEAGAVAGARPGPPGRPTTGIVQPPVHALAAWHAYRLAPDPAARRSAAGELSWLYPRLVAQQRYLTGGRDLGGAGLACIVHPWESGQDNSPAWDAALAAVPADLALLERYPRRDLDRAAETHRPTDRDYARYIRIAESYRDGGYRDDLPGERYPFRVECPTFNALLAAAEHALARIAGVVGTDPAPHRARAARLTQLLVDRLFDPATGMFQPRDLHTGRLSRKPCLGGLVPLILPDLPAGQVKALLAVAGSDRFGLAEQMTLPLPSYDRTAADLDPVRYWRGPIWVNLNWLVWLGLRRHREPALAAALRRSILDLVREHGCYEYFHATTGAGVGTEDFSWTAALTLDLLAQPE